MRIGRAQRQADVCYSWWVLSSLAVLNRVHWIDANKLTGFILACQDPDRGGIADHPNNCGDVYHTFFGLCGLSLLGFMTEGEARFGEGIDPVYALPKKLVRELGLRSTKVAAEE
jgi:geranylgeranyl transferase type-2 subunit beta